MKNITELLAKYTKITPPDDAVKRAVVEVIHNTLGVRVDRDAIQVRQKKVFVRDDPHLKNRLVLHKEELLKKLQGILGTQAPQDIG